MCCAGISMTKFIFRLGKKFNPVLDKNEMGGGNCMTSSCKSTCRTADTSKQTLSVQKLKVNHTILQEINNMNMFF